MINNKFDPLTYNSVEESTQNNYKIAYSSLIDACLIVHGFLILLFYILEIPLMYRLNIISTILYIGVRIDIHFRKSYDIAIIIAFAEISFHSILATAYLGWDSGFYLYVIGLVPMAYLSPIKKRYISHLLALFATAAFYVTKLFVIPFNSISTISDNDICNSLFYFNSMGSFAIIFALTLTFLNNLEITKNALNKRNNVLREIACIDPLTGLINRRVMYEYINTIKENDCDYSVAIGDIDDFKIINDTYGHDCGDYVLTEISRIFSNLSNENVKIARWGGEEFLFLFLESEKDSASGVINNILDEMRHKIFTYGDKTFGITMTFGISDKSISKDISNAIVEADKNLYYGKSHGKNKIVSDCKAVV